MNHHERMNYLRICADIPTDTRGGCGSINAPGCPPGQVCRTFESPPGSGQYISQCGQAPISSNPSGKLPTPKSSTGCGDGCRPGYTCKRFESPPGSGQYISQCVFGIRPKPPAPKAASWRLYGYKPILRNRVALRRGGCGC